MLMMLMMMSKRSRRKTTLLSAAEDAVLLSVNRKYQQIFGSQQPCAKPSTSVFFTREATLHPLRILTYRKTVMSSIYGGFQVSTLSVVGEINQLEQATA